MVSHGCIDDDVNFDVSKECADVTGNVTGGAAAGESNTTACLNTLTCILGNPATTTTPVSCANTGASGDGISNCYCGSNEPNTIACNGAAACTAATPAGCTAGEINGTCFQVSVNGAGVSNTTLPSSVIPLLLNTGNGTGKANQILNCAGTNLATPKCGTCFQ
jgi:hypothetical protein